MVDIVKGGGRWACTPLAPTLSRLGYFSIMIECTPDSCRCHSVCTLWLASTALLHPRDGCELQWGVTQKKPPRAKSCKQPSAANTGRITTSYFSWFFLCNDFLYVFWLARICWPLLSLCRPFCIFDIDVRIRTQRADVASRRATILATHLPNLSSIATHLPNLSSSHPSP